MDRLGQQVSTATAPRVFETGEGRKAILSFIFLVLLPFLISFPAMILLRSFHGYWSDATSAIVIALLFSIWMALLFVNIVSAFRTRIAVDDDKVALSVPRWRGPNPGINYLRETLPLDDVESVETRCEIYRAVQVPVLTRATVVRKNNGDQILLGYVNEDAPDPALNFPEIGKLIADRAGAPYIEKGSIYAGSHVRAMRSGPPAWDAPTLSETEYTEYRRNHQWAMMGFAFLLFGLAAIGFFIDLYRSGLIIPGA